MFIYLYLKMHSALIPCDSGTPELPNQIWVLDDRQNYKTVSISFSHYCLSPISPSTLGLSATLCPILIHLHIPFIYSQSSVIMKILYAISKSSFTYSNIPLPKTLAPVQCYTSCTYFYYWRFAKPTNQQLY